MSIDDNVGFGGEANGETLILYGTGLIGDAALFGSGSIPQMPNYRLQPFAEYTHWYGLWATGGRAQSTRFEASAADRSRERIKQDL